MAIKESLVRQNMQDKIDIGNVVKKALNGAFGEVLRALINGLVTRELTYNQEDSKIPADRKLGRCEAYNNVLLELERSVQEAEFLTAPVEDN